MNFLKVILNTPEILITIFLVTLTAFAFGIFIERKYNKRTFSLGISQSNEIICGANCKFLFGDLYEISFYSIKNPSKKLYAYLLANIYSVQNHSKYKNIVNNHKYAPPFHEAEPFYFFPNRIMLYVDKTNTLRITLKGAEQNDRLTLTIPHIHTTCRKIPQKELQKITNIT